MKNNDTKWKVSFLFAFLSSFIFYSPLRAEEALNDTAYISVSTVNELSAFRDNVNNGVYTDSIIKVSLTADLDLGTSNWTPMGTSSQPFSGLFDGNNYKITYSSYSESITVDDNLAPALFGYVKDNTTIKNLNVDATINSSYKFASGLVNFVYSGKLQLNNCFLNVDLTFNGSESDATFGGLIGLCNNGLTSIGINHCAAVSHLSYPAKSEIGGIGGFIGWFNDNTTTIDNSYAYVTKEDASLSISGASLVRGGSDLSRDLTLTNAYYLTEINFGQGTQKDATAFANGEVAYLLDNGASNVRTTNWSQGDLYPILSSDANVYKISAMCEGNAIDSMYATAGSTASYFTVTSYDDPETLSVTDEAGNSVTTSGTTFTMPAKDVKIVGYQFVFTQYKINIDDEVLNGSFVVSTDSAASDVIDTITVIPDNLYTLNEITVKDVDDNMISLTEISDTTYSFVMPSGDVWVSGSFLLSEPTNVEVSSIGSDSISIVWDAVDGINSYDVLVSETEITDEQDYTGFTTVNTNALITEASNISTGIYVYVRSLLSADSSAWAAPVRFYLKHKVTISTAAELIRVRNKVNLGYDYDISLDADIDLGSDGWTAIGTDAHRYSGSFNGNNHTITYAATYDGIYLNHGPIAPSFFGAVINIEVKNLTLKATLTSNKRRASAFVCTLYGAATFENCIADVDYTFTNSSTDDVTFGGFVGYKEYSDSTVSIINCGVVGNISSDNTANITGIGYFIGWSFDGAINITNSFSNISEDNITGGENFARYGSNCTVSIKNSYYSKQIGTSTQGTLKDSLAFVNGEVAYLLDTEGADVRTNNWSQGDLYPILSPDANVYKISAVSEGSVVDSMYAVAGSTDLSYFTIAGFSDPEDLNVTDELGNTVATSGNTFTMPEYNVNITGYQAVEQDLNIDDAVLYGSITVTDTSAFSGVTETITVVPDNLYTLNEITVKDAEDNTISLTEINDSTYSFVMPRYDVWISASFGLDVPTNVEVARTGNNSISVVWDAVDGVSSYDVLVSETEITDEQDYTGFTTVNTNAFTTKASNINTGLYVYVRSILSADSSVWTVPVHFYLKHKVIISTAEELKSMRDSVNLGYGFDVSLTADIDLGTDSWTAIGTETNRFDGSFNGNDHTITYTATYTGNDLDVGDIAPSFFGAVTNIEVNNLKLEATLSSKKRRTSAFVCSLYGSAEFSNCFADVDYIFTNSETDDATFGGLIGYKDSNDSTVTISNCGVVGSISSTNQTTITGIGYFIGWSYDGDITITNSYSNISEDEITAGENLARFGDGDINISNSYYYTQISSSSQGTQKDAEAFANGEVAYLLDNGALATRTTNWSQGEVYPILSSDANIYKISAVSEGSVIDSSYVVSGSTDLSYIYVLGYDFPDVLDVQDDEGNSMIAVGDATFTMPAEDVKILGYQSQVDYQSNAHVINIDDEVLNGSFTVTNTSAVSGIIDTITVVSHTSYALNEITVKDKANNAVSITVINDSTYSFVMPSCDVWVSGSFALNAPANVVVSRTDNNSLSIVWDAVDGISSYDVLVSETEITDAQDVTGFTTVNTNAFTTKATNLNTGLYVYVRSLLSADSSVWTTPVHYYLRKMITISTAAELKSFRDSVNLGYAFDVSLGADIDLGSDSWTAIGTETNRYDGSFNGNDYTITYAATSTDGDDGDIAPAFFGAVSAIEVENLKIEATLNSNKQRASAFVSTLYGTATFEKCFADVAYTFTNSDTDEAVFGGLIGYKDNNDSTVSISNCGVVGSISSENRTSITGVGYFMGWSGDGDINITNSYSNISEDEITAGENFVCTGNSAITIADSYYCTPIGTSTQGTQKDSLAFANGEVAYSLDMGFSYSRTTNWSQGDSYPILSSEANVYKIAAIYEDTEVGTDYAVSGSAVTYFSVTGFSNPETFNVKDENDNAVAATADSTFTMPTSDVKIYGYTLHSASINIDPEVQNGSFSVANSSATYGDTIQINILPSEGYTLETITVTNSDNESITLDDDSTFIMPMGSDVTISGSFALNAPTNVAVSRSGNSSISIVWDAVDGISSYDVLVSETKITDENDYTAFTTVSGNAFVTEASNIKTGLYIYVRSVLAADSSAWTSAVHFYLKHIAIISTAEELISLRDSVNMGYDFDVSLVADIDLGSDSWIAMGTEDYKFNGSFNGNDHTITYFATYTGPDVNDGDLAPSFFGAVTSISVKNLTLKATLNSYKRRASAFVCTLYGGAVFENCVADVDYTYTNATTDDATFGGFVGYKEYSDSTVSITNCGVVGSISFVNQTDITGIGYFVGWSFDGVINITNSFSNVSSWCWNGEISSASSKIYEVNITSGENLSRQDDACTLNVSNSYYCNLIGTSTQGIEKDSAAFVNGEVAYLLDNGASDARTTIWSQGVLNPVLSPDSNVYKISALYEGVAIDSMYATAGSPDLSSFYVPGFNVPETLDVQDKVGNSITSVGDVTFTMPTVDVGILGYTLDSLTIHVDTEVQNGTFSVADSTVFYGDTIKIDVSTVAPYALKNFTVTTTNGDTITVAADSTFIMPAGYDVTVSGEFWQTEGLAITCASVDNGSFSVTSATANYGDEIKIEVSAAEGYVLKTMTVTASNDESITVAADSTFIMPAGVDVTVSGEFWAYYDVTLENAFIEGFEAGNLDTWGQQSEEGSEVWTINSTNTTNRTPYAGSYNVTLQNDNVDCLFTPLYLHKDTTYVFEMQARQDMDDMSDANLTVMLGQAANDAAMTSTLVAETGLSNGTYQRLFGSITPTTSGIYILGIKGNINSDAHYIAIDDIKMEVNNTVTSVEDPQIVNAIHIYSRAHSIIIENAQLEQKAQVYNISGQCVANTMNRTIAVPRVGLYIVRIGNETQKVMVK